MTTTITTVSADQYRAAQNPILLLTSSEWFEYGIEALHNKGINFPKADIDLLYKEVPQGHKLVLPVPPLPDELDLEGLMAKVEVDGKTGKNYLDRQHLSDVVQAPKTAHLLLDVEDGRNRLNTKPSVSLDNIQREGRIPYTTWRGIVHAIVFPHVFQSHNMDLVGSRYGSGFVPYLYLLGGFPELFSFWDAYATPRWGAPSAGSVVGA
ncbi:MAG: DUF5701 family protein [Candidatus Binatia bacterium]